MKQVIVISPEGELNSLAEYGPVSLSQFGKARMSRATQILWDEVNQAWYIKWYNSYKYGSTVWTVSNLKANGVDLGFGYFDPPELERVSVAAVHDSPRAETWGWTPTNYQGGPVNFDTYQAAIDFERAVITQLLERSERV